MENIVKLIVDSGYLKRSEIADALGTRWATVQRWYKDHNYPNDKYREKLQELYANKQFDQAYNKYMKSDLSLLQKLAEGE